LTDEELGHIKEMTGAVLALGVKIKHNRLEYVNPNGYFDSKYIDNYKAILWLANLFDLED
jgi:hypothetical protein